MADHPAILRGAMIYYLGLGDAFRQKMDLDAALREYHRAAGLAETSPIPHISIGETLEQLGQYDRAVEAFELAAKHDPTHPYPHLALGRLYGNLGRHAEAVTEYRRGIELNMEHGLRLEPYTLWTNLAAHEEELTSQGREGEMVAGGQRSHPTQAAT